VPTIAVDSGLSLSFNASRLPWAAPDACQLGCMSGQQNNSHQEIGQAGEEQGEDNRSGWELG
jgi:hypothetical protein